jgi:restriction system protein
LYDYRVDPPLTREEILASPPPLGTYKPFAWLMGTNHLIHDSAVVKALDAAIQGRLVALATGLTSSAKLQESKIDLEQAIRNAKRETSHSLAEAIAEMDPIAFEWLVRAVLAELGYVNIVVTKPCDDGGVDLRARLVAKGVTSIETAVQVKRTASVGRPVVQNLRGSLTAHESGLLVTSGHFSVGAEAEAHEPTKVPIALVNGSKLVELLLEIGIGARQQTFKVYTLDPEALSLERLKERAIEVFAASDGD